MAEHFPDLIDMRSVRISIDDSFNWIVEHWGAVLEEIFLPVVHLLIAIENFLLWLPWYAVLIIIAIMGFAATRSWKTAAGLSVLMFLLGFFGLWEPGMKTGALMLTATLLAVIIGIPLGIWMSRSGGVERVILPVLDIMQTMPAFVYLIPVVMLLGIGKVPGVIAVVIYAIPPVIRLTNLGIRLVDKEVLEAAAAFGATPLQRLFGVQIPLAMPTIMAGINQTIMMALAMLVITALVGTRELGQEVYTALASADTGRGLVAGVCVAFIAIIADRLIGAWAKRRKQELGLE